MNNAASRVNNDAGDSNDSAGSIQIEEIHNDTCCSASSQEVFNTGHSANEAPQQVGAVHMSCIIEKVCKQQHQNCIQKSNMKVEHFIIKVPKQASLICVGLASIRTEDRGAPVCQEILNKEVKLLLN